MYLSFLFVLLLELELSVLTLVWNSFSSGGLPKVKTFVPQVLRRKLSVSGNKQWPQQHSSTGQPADVPRTVVQPACGCDAWPPHTEDW